MFSAWVEILCSSFKERRLSHAKFYAYVCVRVHYICICVYAYTHDAVKSVCEGSINEDNTLLSVCKVVDKELDLL